MKENYKISVIIPAYNVEDYIEQCLRSVMNQTYKNLEIIVVNDGSKDNTADIIKKLADEDKRIVFIDQENQGVSASRNNALSKIDSDFVMFLDSDDWLDLDACEYLMQEAIKENADCVMFGYVREYGDNSLTKSAFDEDRLIFEGQEVKEKLHRRLFGPIGEELASPEKLNAISTIWGKLYKSEFVKNVEFVSLQELGLCEDGYFNINVFKKLNKVVFVRKYFYHYRKIVGGVSLTQRKDSNIFEKEKKFYSRLNEIIEKQKLTDDYKIAIDNRFALSLIEVGISIFNSKSNVYKNIKNVLHSNEYRGACQNLELKYFPIHWKLFFGFAKIKFTFGVYFLLKVIVLMMNKK